MAAASRQLGIAQQRWQWIVRGQVQGVGFRPFVCRVARGLGLNGFVRNTTEGVRIECQGAAVDLERFATALEHDLPPLAVVRGIELHRVEAEGCEDGFTIGVSDRSIAERGTGEVTVDTAVCPDCLRELFSCHDRRFAHPLINCTNCGPRYSIVRAVPYDRCNTTMAGFAMCPACAAEYENPTDRRFHAQPVSCHECGPRLSLMDYRGNVNERDPIVGAADRLARGEIVAVKGIGGFHLAVRADSEPCVARLRTLKRREHKPFAVMCADVLAATRLVELSASAKRLLCSPSAPIVLAQRRAFAPVAPSVALDSHRLGVMLPYTPIHHLLFRALGPYAPPLVMTSGNLSDEPLVIDDAEALRVLGRVCDAILLHDRPVERPVDDSVFIDVADDEPLPVRRARGFVPSPIPLPVDSGSQGLAVGGELKNTVAVVTGGTAVVSQHLGDVTRAASLEVFRRTIRDLCDLFHVAPGWVARDMHPMYLSGTVGRALAASLEVPLVDVQHHHAHAAAVMAEHGVEGPVLAVVCDGTGYGSDGTIWGGELLVADLVSFRRLGRLRPLRLAGGDAAAKDVRRCAMALMYGAMGEEFRRHAIVERMVPDGIERRTLCEMIERNVACATSSGAGRYFDGVAAILGLCTRNRFEAEAAMALEAAAARCHGETPGMTGDLFEIDRGGELTEINLAPLVRAIVAGHGQGTPREALALLFHEQFAHAWATMVTEAVRSTGIETVALSGGVFCNELLTRRLTHLLRARGLRVLRHRVVPPNDGGLSLGQAAVAAARMRQRRRREAR